MEFASGTVGAGSAGTPRSREGSGPVATGGPMIGGGGGGGTTIGFISSFRDPVVGTSWRNRGRERQSRHRGRTLPAEIHDHAIRVVQREDAVRLDPLHVHDDARRVLRMPAEPDLAHDVFVPGDGAIAQVGRRLRAAQIEEQPLRILERFLPEDQLAVDLDRDAHAIGQGRTRDSTERRGAGRNGFAPIVIDPAR